MKKEQIKDPMHEEMLDLVNSIQFRVWAIMEEEEFEKLESKFENIYKLPLSNMFEDDVFMFLTKYTNKEEKNKLNDLLYKFQNQEMKTV